ncbi:MAG: hypothetical protein ACYCUG_04075 [Acidimicrobiales bacterium]
MREVHGDRGRSAEVRPEGREHDGIAGDAGIHGEAVRQDRQVPAPHLGDPADAPPPATRVVVGILGEGGRSGSGAPAWARVVPIEA